MLDVSLPLLVKKVPFLPSTDAIICNQLTPLPAQCSNQVFLNIPQRFQAWVAHAPNCLKHSAKIQKCNLTKINEVDMVDMKYIDFVLLIELNLSLKLDPSHCILYSVFCNIADINVNQPVS